MKELEFPFSKMLRARRVLFGLSQTEMADLLGISQTTYCFMESGKRKPKKLELKELCEVLRFDFSTAMENRQSAD
jgi:DNA-binding XRE family transcriptional regulator